MSIVGDYDNGQFDDYYEICDREYDEEIYWDLKTLLDLAEELPMYITGIALAEDQEMIEYLGDSILELLNRFRGHGMGQREEEKLDERLVTLFRYMADQVKSNGCEELEIYETIAKELEKVQLALKIPESKKIKIEVPEKIVAEVKEELDREQLYKDACCYMEGRRTQAEREAAIFKSIRLQSSGEIITDNTWKENRQALMPTRESVYKAEEIFKKLGDYRDSQEKYQLCREMKFGILGLLVKGGSLFSNARRGDRYIFTIDNKLDIFVKIYDKTYSANSLRLLEGEHEVCVKQIVRLNGYTRNYAPNPVKIEIKEYEPKVVIASNNVKDTDASLKLKVVDGLI